MAAVMMYVNERVHVDLSGEDLGAERPILGAVDCPFFISPDGDTFVSPMSLVGSLTFPFYLAAMRRPDLADDPRFRTPALRLANLADLHQIVQTWIWTFDDMASLRRADRPGLAMISTKSTAGPAVRHDPPDPASPPARSTPEPASIPGIRFMPAARSAATRGKIMSNAKLVVLSS
jgi:crotonobetainyl-CoA:carnitine CoA-transferase CaiB-like acyl-CoA transferase